MSTLPLPVLAGALNVKTSPSASVAATAPVTAPVTESGALAVGVVTVGAELTGATGTKMLTIDVTIWLITVTTWLITWATASTIPLITAWTCWTIAVIGSTDTSAAAGVTA